MVSAALKPILMGCLREQQHIRVGFEVADASRVEELCNFGHFLSTHEGTGI